MSEPDMTIKEDASVLKDFVSAMQLHLRKGEKNQETGQNKAADKDSSEKDLVALLKRDWEVVRLTKSDDIRDRDALSALLDDLSIQAGWMVTTDAVYFIERGIWTRWGEGKRNQPDFGRVLDADLALDEHTGMRITHLGGTRWRVETILEGEEAGDPHLMTKDTHYSVLKGRTLRHAVYWRPQPVAGDAALTCHQPVAARLLGFGDREKNR